MLTNFRTSWIITLLLGLIVLMSPIAIHAGPPGNTILGVYVGNTPADVTKFEQWLSRPVDGVLGYTGNASWQDYDGSVGWATGLWANTKRTILWSVPLIPTGATLADAASGSYNSHYTQAAQTLANFRPADTVIYLRTAWEWNGNWFPWAVSTDQKTNFKNAWHQFVTSFRSVSTKFRFDWCPSIGTNPYSWEDAYPGDADADIIGIDVYDETIWCKIDDPAARWQFELTRDHGLNWVRDFATSHHKRISVAEWGTGGNGGGDNPVMIQKMYDWCDTNQVVYQTYWNSNADYPGMLSDGTKPLAAAKYKQLFGGTAAIGRPVPAKSSAGKTLRTIIVTTKLGRNSFAVAMPSQGAIERCALYSVNGKCFRVFTPSSNQNAVIMLTGTDAPAAVVPPGTYLLSILGKEFSLVKSILIQ